MNYNKIILIPPNGKLKKQDFSLHRINKWLKDFNIEVILMLISEKDEIAYKDDFENVVMVEDEIKLFEAIKTIDYDCILHRSWMGAYSFAAKLIQKFDNVIVNIKDWNFASKEVYEFLFPDTQDFDGIDFIFKNGKTILSHFTDEQALLWAKEYNTDKDKFIFFPEYCNKDNFNRKPPLKYENIKLVYAGRIPSSCLAEDYFPGKAHLRSIKVLTQQHIDIDFVFPPAIYEDVYKTKNMFLDFIYESEMNPHFNILKGQNLGSDVLNKYHFGFFELETSGVNTELYEYAITSKFAFYLEAGLPMLINEKFKSMSQLVQEHQLGIVFSNDDLSNISKKLTITQNDYNDFVRNIEKFRKDFTYQRQCDLSRLLRYACS